jgi:hypothetical protein
LILSSLNYELRSKNTNVAKIVNGELVAVGEGQAEIYVYFLDLPESEE